MDNPTDDQIEYLKIRSFYSTKKDKGPPMDTQKMMALVLDDQQNWRELLADLLLEDFEVVQAESLAEAIEKLLSNDPPFELVVTDLRLLDIEQNNEDGLKLAEELRQFGSQTNVIVVTGYPTVKSAKEALGKLKVFDYLEKYPHEGDFDEEEFIRIARQAGELTRKMRPTTLNRKSQVVLIVEPNEGLRRKIANILSHDGYVVESAASTEEYEKVLRKPDAHYSLVFMDDALLLANNELIAGLQDLQPQARFITLASDKYAEHVNGLVEKGVFQVIPVRENEIDDQQVRKIIHQALAPETHRYITLELNKVEHPEEMVTEYHLGQDLQLFLKMQNKPNDETCEIWLKSPVERRDWVDLQVQVFAAQMEVQPSISRLWEVSPDGFANKLEFILTPRDVGKKKIVVHLYHGGRFMGKMEKMVSVCSD
jgi:DNA-binding NtrC family response regulator